MPTVLITGLNGFVAVHTAAVFLKNGWNVRGTVRSLEKGEKVRALPVFQDKKDKIELTVVEDLVAGDFTEALKGVDAIAHCASPWHFKGESWASYRDPAVKGTTNIMEQAAKVDSIKAIGVVSSFAAIGDFSIPADQQDGKLYTENDWLPWTDEYAETIKADDPMAAVQWYCISKKYAELAARDVQKRLSPGYSVSTINPPVILGPAIHYGPGSTAEDLKNADVSTTDTFNAIGAGKDGQVPPSPFPIYADVRNVADALYLSIDKRSNGRFPLFNDVFDYQSLANRSRELFPDLAKADQIPLGNPEDTPSTKGTFKVDGSKAEKELGLKYIPKEQMLKETMESFIAIGAVKA